MGASEQDFRARLTGRIDRYRGEAAVWKERGDTEEAVRLERAANIVGSILHELDADQVDPKATERLPDPGLTREEIEAAAKAMWEADTPVWKPWGLASRSRKEQVRKLVRVVAAALSAPESEQGELTPEECRELFSLWLCHGIPPDEIDHSHPAHTGAMKLGAAQPHPEDGDPGRSLRLPRPESEQGEDSSDDEISLAWKILNLTLRSGREAEAYGEPLEPDEALAEIEWLVLKAMQPPREQGED